jgi:hypothetical protein
MSVLNALTVEDAPCAAAIRRCSQASGKCRGGCFVRPSVTLQAMALAQERDAVARQVCERFAITFTIGLPA